MTDINKLKMIVLAGIAVLAYVMVTPRSIEDMNGQVWTLKGPVEITTTNL